MRRLPFIIGLTFDWAKASRVNPLDVFFCIRILQSPANEKNIGGMRDE